MRDSAKRAQALEFIDRQFHGFSERVDERAVHYPAGSASGCRSRTLLKDPPILILDEATSTLDADTEGKVMRALDEVTNDRTTFVIAHRLATVRKAPRILVFDAGKIVEDGTLARLVAAGGRFAGLPRAQFMVAEPAVAAAH
jgi:ATP-binding cassette subfamily B protein